MLCRLTTEGGRGEGRQLHFWAASMMVGTALPALAVRRLERSEDSLAADIDICGSLNFCPAGPGGEYSNGVAQNPSEQLYLYLKEGDLRWGDVSFFPGAPRDGRASVPACAC